MSKLTAAQWEAKIRAWVPGWFFAEDKNSAAWAKGLAAVAAEMEAELQDNIDQTFILRATGDYLDLHGSERNVIRFSGELDPAYAPRVQRIINNGNKPAIKALVDALLINGQSNIVEDYEASVFCDREYFANRNSILLSETVKDAFSILVRKQIHAPYAYLNGAAFIAREDFIGMLDSSDAVFQSIVAAVNGARLAGATFRIFELVGE